jgi:hypothetical protein
VNAGQEARLPLLFRLVSLLADGAAACPWLLEALAAPEVTARLWTTFELLGASAERQGDLSWYNRALGTTARCALFRLPRLQGDNAQRKAFLIALVSAAKHPDAEVRLAAARALPAVFAVYPNSLGVWDQYRKQGVLVAPGETEEAEEAALLGSPSITAALQPAPLALDRLQRRLGQLLALGAAGRSADRIARVAVLALCRWWAHPAGSPSQHGAGADRSPQVAPPTQQQRRRGGGGGGGGGGSHHASSDTALRSRAARAVRPLVEALLEDMARGLGYPSAGALVEEHLPFLMHEWLVALRLPLAGFPCHLVVAHWRRQGGASGMEEDGREQDDLAEEDEDEEGGGEGVSTTILDRGVTGDGGAEGGRASAAAALPTFIRATLPMLVRLASLAEGGADPTYRFELLAALAAAAGVGGPAPGDDSRARSGASGSGGLSREARVAGAVASHMVELKALELLLRTVPSAEVGAG